jgi:hypothetical protein
MLMMEALPPQPLPDGLMGEQWALVSLAAKELRPLPGGFGEVYLPPLPPQTTVPGLVIFSFRALAMSAYMQGRAPVNLCYEDQERLVLEVGSGERWLLARFKKDPQRQREAQLFASRKQASGGLHFLALQLNPQSEAPTGFWTLWDARTPDESE